MKYVVLSDRRYMNSFATYTQAEDLREELERKGHRNVIIVTYEEWKTGNF